MKKIIIGVLIAVLVCGVGFGAYTLYSRYGVSDENGIENSNATQNGNKTAPPPGTTPYVNYIEPEYYGSINDGITLEQLRSNKVVWNIRIFHEGAPWESATIFIFRAEVIGISDRVLTLAKEGDVLELYIGENAEIGLTTPDKPTKVVPFGEIKEGDAVNIAGGMQTSPPSPLRIIGIYILRGFD